MDRNLLTAFGLLLGAYAIRLKTKLTNRRRRRYKVRPLNRHRKQKGGFLYFLHAKRNDPEQFFKMTRMTVNIFNKLLKMVTPLIKKNAVKDGISAEQRLAFTLQYLAQGGSMQSLAWTYHIGLTTASVSIHSTCRAIWDVLVDPYLKTPTSEMEWKNISQGFNDLWNFPNCLGALDGKHISIQAPTKSGSAFFNYKNYFSTVLLAACDSNYLFTLVDIGAYGSQSDGGILKNSLFGQNFEDATMNVPPPAELPNANIKVPYCLVADEAFPLKQYIMRPFPGKNLSLQQRIFNYRLSRARRCIENAFGILVSRWRILKQTIIAKVNNIDNIVKACVVLHNFCKLEGIGKTPNNYCPPGYVDTNDEDNGGWRNDIDTPLLSVGRLSSNNAARITYSVRDTLAGYFVSPEGEVPWQLQAVNRGTEPI